MHAELREAGPVVYLSRYDVYAFARYDEVHAALVDWQSFQSAAGRRPVQLPPREAVAAAEPAARGRPAAPRRPPARAAEDARSACAARAREGWAADAEALVDEVLATRHEFDAVAALAADVPAAGLSRRRRHPAGGTGEPAALRRPRLQRLRPAQRPGREGRPAGRGALGVGQRAVRAGRADDRRLRRANLGRRRPRRHHPGAGPARRPVPAHRRRRHDRARPRRRPLRLRHPPRRVAAAARPTRARARRVRRGGSPGVARPDLLPHRHHRRRRRRHVVPDGQQDPHVPRPRPTATRAAGYDPDAFDLSRDPSGHVGFGMGIHQCVGQHVARLEAEALLTALARRVRTHRARRARPAAPQQHAARLGEHPGAGRAWPDGSPLLLAHPGDLVRHWAAGTRPDEGETTWHCSTTAPGRARSGREWTDGAGGTYDAVEPATGECSVRSARRRRRTCTPRRCGRSRRSGRGRRRRSRSGRAVLRRAGEVLEANARRDQGLAGAGVRRDPAVRRLPGAHQRAGVLRGLGAAQPPVRRAAAHRRRRGCPSPAACRPASSA